MGGGGSQPTGYTGTKPMSAEDLNSAMRGDIQASYLKGPVQTSYVGMGQGTKDSLNNLISTAGANRGILDQALSFNTGILNSGGINPTQQASIDYTRGIMDSGGLSADQRSAIDYTRGVMQGGENDEAFQRLRTNAIDDARTAVNRQFGASGRFGSGGQMIDLGRGLADAAASMDFQNLQRRDAAASNLFGMGQTGLTNATGAASNLFNMGQTGTANAMAAADRSGDLYRNTLLPYQTQIQAQGLLDADNQARAAFDPNYTHLAKYQALLGNNAAGPQPAKQPGFMDYAMLGGGLLSSFL